MFGGNVFSLRKAKINPLLHYDKNKVTSVFIDREALNLTFVIKERGPLTVWFHSLFDLEKAYAEWEMEKKKGGGEAGLMD